MSFISTRRSAVWKSLLLMVVMVVAAVSAGACGAAEEPTPTPTSTVAAPQPTPTPTPVPTKKGGGTLVIAMTASAVPLTDGQPDQGFEGFRFVGYQLYDGLTRWDLAQEEKPAGIMPGLAESWEVVGDNPTKWIVHLRRGVKFHDGTDWNADALIWDWDRIKTPTAPQYNAVQAGVIGFRIVLQKAWRKIDDYTVEFTNSRPNAFFPFNVVYALHPSPTRIQQMGADDYPKNPAGTGPWKLVELSPREKLVMEPNTDYWGMVPRADRLILLPMPEATTRVAAIRAGQVNWIEVPPPDAIPGLQKDGFQVKTRVYPHTWPYQLNLLRPPWNNKLVRQAAMYAIDRESLSRDILNGTATPATSMIYEGHIWFGNPVRYNYDPQKARDLLAQAGYPNGFETTFLITPSGSGQMMPLPMNEFVQKNFAEVGIKLKFEVIDWGEIGRAREGFYKRNAHLDAFNVSMASVDPYSAFVRFYHTDAKPPNAWNVGEYSNPEVDRLIESAEQAATTAERDRLLSRVNEIVSEDVPWIYVVHDLNPRVLAPNVRDMVHAQSWFVDLQLPWVAR